MQDIGIDIESRDIIIQSNSNDFERHDVRWGKILRDDVDSVSYMNIIIPDGVEASSVYNGDDKIDIKIKTSYHPSKKPLVFRILKKAGSNYSVVFRGDAVTLKPNSEMPESLKACFLPAIDIDGRLTVKCYDGSAYIFSADYHDITINSKLYQETSLMALCSKGDLYRYPITGIGAWDYVNSIPTYTDLPNIIQEQLAIDGKSVVSAEFDETTAKLNIDVLDNFTSTLTSDQLERVGNLDTASIKVKIYDFDNSGNVYITIRGQYLLTSNSEKYLLNT